jgi:hypothetical protein
MLALVFRPEAPHPVLGPEGRGTRWIGPPRSRAEPTGAVPEHAGETICPRLLHSILDQAGPDVDEFRRAL